MNKAREDQLSRMKGLEVAARSSNTNRNEILLWRESKQALFSRKRYLGGGGRSSRWHDSGAKERVEKEGKIHQGDRRE